MQCANLLNASLISWAALTSTKRIKCISMMSNSKRRVLTANLLFTSSSLQLTHNWHLLIIRYEPICSGRGYKQRRPCEDCRNRLQCLKVSQFTKQSVQEARALISQRDSAQRLRTNQNHYLHFDDMPVSASLREELLCEDATQKKTLQLRNFVHRFHFCDNSA